MLQDMTVGAHSPNSDDCEVSCDDLVSILDEKSLDIPELSLRWRIYNRQLPLKARHYQALRAYGLSDGLVSWVIQHIEWTLPEGSLQEPHGVLTLDVDKSGKAAMDLVPFVELASVELEDLVQQAACHGTRAQDGVDSQLLWALRDNQLIILTDEQAHPSAVHSLMMDLAKYKQLELSFQADYMQSGGEEYEALLSRAQKLRQEGYEFLLLSDEYGVIAEALARNPHIQFFVQSWKKLLVSLG